MQAAVDAFEERRARREREQLRQEAAQRVVHRDRAVAAADTDMHVQAEAVVAPDDVAEDLVVAAVVRRVDDPLILPAAPRMCSGGAEQQPLFACQRLQLPATLPHPGSRLTEVGALPRAHLGLRRDQLADEMLIELRTLRRSLQLLEAVDELEAVGVEQRELLLDGDGEVGACFERRVRRGELLLGGKPLLLAHRGGG